MTSFDGMLLKLLTDTCAFQKLTHLNLSNNNMVAFLNQEVSSDFTMANVKWLNILENMKMPVQHSIIQMKNLFPNLESLDLSLSEE